MKPFKPTRADGKSYRDVAIEALNGLTPDTIVSYQMIGSSLGLSPSNDLQKIQAIIRLANVILLKRYSRCVCNVPKVGYRILPAREHITVAEAHHTRSYRAAGRELCVLQYVRLNEMNEKDRRLHQNQHMLAQALVASHRHLSKRIDKIETLLRGTPTTNS